VYSNQEWVHVFARENLFQFGVISGDLQYYILFSHLLIPFGKLGNYRQRSIPKVIHHENLQVREHLMRLHWDLHITGILASLGEPIVTVPESFWNFTSNSQAISQLYHISCDLKVIVWSDLWKVPIDTQQNDAWWPAFLLIPLVLRLQSNNIRIEGFLRFIIWDDL
jgi:hypothetical protein